jgi:hypothetical protein
VTWYGFLFVFGFGYVVCLIAWWPYIRKGWAE